MEKGIEIFNFQIGKLFPLSLPFPWAMCSCPSLVEVFCHALSCPLPSHFSMIKQRKINLLKKKKVNSFLFLLIFLYQDSSAKHPISCGETARERMEGSEERTGQLLPFTAGSGGRQCEAREAFLPSCWWALSSAQHSANLDHFTFGHVVAASWPLVSLSAGSH